MALDVDADGMQLEMEIMEEDLRSWWRQREYIASMLMMGCRRRWRWRYMGGELHSEWRREEHIASMLMMIIVSSQVKVDDLAPQSFFGLLYLSHPLIHAPVLALVFLAPVFAPVFVPFLLLLFGLP